MITKITSSLYFILLFCITGTSFSADWSKWRGPNANSIVNDTSWDPNSLENGTHIRWDINIGQGFSGITIKGERLFTVGNVIANNAQTDIVYCLDTNSGKEIWKFSYPCSRGEHAGPGASPVVDGENLYTLSKEGALYCLDISSGKVKWQKNIVSDFKAVGPTWNFAGSPVIEENLLILNAGNAGMALDKNNGKLIWSNGGGTGGYASPVVFTHKGQRLVAVFGEKQIVVLEAKTGKKMWSMPWETAYNINGADPLYHDNMLFFSSGYNKGAALVDLAETPPKLMWQNKTIGCQFSSFVLIDGYLYGFDGNVGRRAELKCVKFNTGEEVWSERLGYGSLIAVNNHLLVLDESGTLYVVEVTPQGYHETAKAKVLKDKVCWTAPSISNGIVYVRNNPGQMVCIDMRK